MVFHSQVVDDAIAAPIPTNDPVVLNLPVSGTTASIALEKKGELKKGENVLVTAAAGATGQFVSIGCDRTVNYNKESLNDVLAKEYPNGVDVVYESVGNEMFETCLKNLSIFGRLIVIGAISGYESKEGAAATGSNLPIPLMALRKSADVRGFFLVHYKSEVPAHIARLSQLITTGQLKAVTDNGEKSDKGPFRGIEMVYDAVEYMYAKKNTGKVVVKISD
ncbi:Zinc-binding alcohol dehydrogenase domain-containing protein 2-like [Plakobranchus ocellatus]|uniref:Zinc-binding alcohol dehydrogenase domain-containing protein 2-like n=1 Tax=Plakobranchus ocellatus TaxID=259542 RepID=A0AAV3ZLW0_9GAST|nr:Zinc-binding alcohol dehydrogenase domain-containing protein 2-like [Plakobranchus ocellatus]